MTNQIISKRLKSYNAVNTTQEENALKEILQDITLYALSTTDFFKKALFHGGTALRILYDLPRFSEDLDFMLKKKSKDFRWEQYIDEIKKTLTLYNIAPEITDRSKTDAAIQRLFLKDNSIGKILQLNFQHDGYKKICIKFEIDTNPPSGSETKMRYLNFPIDYAIATQDLPSNFAGKCHALLCRDYVKGRDWFDFTWYVSRRTPLNFIFFQNAMLQVGPWKNEKIKFNKAWLIEQLSLKIRNLNWAEVRKDVFSFVAQAHRESLKLWSVDFFLDKLRKFDAY